MTRRAVAAVNRVLGVFGVNVVRVATPQAGGSADQGPVVSRDFYHEVYESHARQLPPSVSIGGGDYDEMGENMFSALVHHGLEASDTLLDFGCGTGRLSRCAVPYLTEGRYIGLDISETMLVHAAASLGGDAASRVTWTHHVGDDLPYPDASIDMICAFSVFTHMEHEDTYRYLRELRRVVAPDGSLVCSVLTMDLDAARDVFLRSAADDLATRWQGVRNVTTSYEMMSALAEMAHWKVEAWYPGNEALIPKHGTDDERCAIGQTILVLRPSGD